MTHEFTPKKHCPNICQQCGGYAYYPDHDYDMVAEAASRPTRARPGKASGYRKAIRERVDRAQDALATHYREEAQFAVTDLLADLRHFCDAHKLCFGDLDRIAHGHYVAEKGGEL